MGTPQISICGESGGNGRILLRAPADLESVGRGGSTTITFVAKQLNHGLSLPTKQSGLALAIHLPNANLNNRKTSLFLCRRLYAVSRSVQSIEIYVRGNDFAQNNRKSVQYLILFYRKSVQF